MHQNNLSAFIHKFDEVVAERITPAMLQPEIIIDAIINFEDITPSFYKIIQQMEPFGPNNMRHVFVVNEVQNTEYSKIVKENHIRFVLQQNTQRVKDTGCGTGNTSTAPEVLKSLRFYTAGLKHASVGRRNARLCPAGFIAA